MCNRQTNNSLISARDVVVSAMASFFHFPLSRLHNQPTSRFQLLSNTHQRKQLHTGLVRFPANHLKRVNPPRHLTRAMLSRGTTCASHFLLPVCRLSHTAEIAVRPHASSA